MNILRYECCHKIGRTHTVNYISFTLSYLINSKRNLKIHSFLFTHHYYLSPYFHTSVAQFIPFPSLPFHFIYIFLFFSSYFDTFPFFIILLFQKFSVFYTHSSSAEHMVSHFVLTMTSR